jgi:hypothetical protein
MSDATPISAYPRSRRSVAGEAEAAGKDIQEPFVGGKIEELDAVA